MLSEKPWRRDSLLLLLCGIFTCFFFFSILEFAALRLTGSQKIDEKSVLWLIFSTLALHGSFLLPVVIYLKLAQISWPAAFGFNSPRKGRAIFLGVAAAVIFLPIGSLTQELSLKILGWLQHGEPIKQEAMETLKNAVSLGCRVYLIFFALVIAPVVEEIFFRGVLYPNIKQLGYPRLAWWATAVAFAAIHQTPSIFLALVLLSLTLTWLYERTNNLLAPIVAHSVFNGINVLLFYYPEALDRFYLHWTHTS